MTDLRTKLMNLYRLAKAGGTEGEAASAERILMRLLAKHGLKVSDLDDQDTEQHMVEFIYHGPYERRMLIHIMAKIGLADEDGRISWYRPTKNTSIRIMFKMTRAQEAEAKLLYSLYLRAFKAEMERMTYAFIHANGLYNSGPGRSWEELTPEEQAEVERIHEMARAMEPVQIHKALRSGR